MQQHKGAPGQYIPEGKVLIVETSRDKMPHGHLSLWLTWWTEQNVTRFEMYPFQNEIKRISGGKSDQNKDLP